MVFHQKFSILSYQASNDTSSNPFLILVNHTQDVFNSTPQETRGVNAMRCAPTCIASACITSIKFNLTPLLIVSSRYAPVGADTMDLLEDGWKVRSCPISARNCPMSIPGSPDFACSQSMHSGIRDPVRIEFHQDISRPKITHGEHVVAGLDFLIPFFGNPGNYRSYACERSSSGVKNTESARWLFGEGLIVANGRP
jgi:hypothetical protein